MPKVFTAIEIGVAFHQADGRGHGLFPGVEGARGEGAIAHAVHHAHGADMACRLRRPGGDLVAVRKGQVTGKGLKAAVFRCPEEESCRLLPGNGRLPVAVLQLTGDDIVDLLRVGKVQLCPGGAGGFLRGGENAAGKHGP